MSDDGIDLYIQADGSVQAVYSDELVELLAGEATTVRRASHVEPDGKGGWTADLSPVGGPVLGPYPTRGQALAEETAWLGAALELGSLSVRES